MGWVESAGRGESCHFKLHGQEKARHQHRSLLVSCLFTRMSNRDHEPPPPFFWLVRKAQCITLCFLGQGCHTGAVSGFPGGLVKHTAGLSPEVLIQNLHL